MTSIGISLALLSIWGAGLAVVGVYWVRRERKLDKFKSL